MGTLHRSPRGQRLRLELEPLEKRCVLSFAGLDLSLPSMVSSLAYSGAGLAAADVEEGGQLVPAWIVGEGADTLADAPVVSVAPDSSVVLLGYIGNSLLLDAAAQQNDIDVFRLDVTGTDELVVQFDLLARSAGSSLDPALTIVGSDGQVLASWDGTTAYEDASQQLDVYRSIGLRPGTYYVLIGSYRVAPAGNSVGLYTPLSTPGGTGRSTGAYALRVRATPYAGPVSVQSVLASGGDLHTPVTVSVTFSGQVDPNTLDGAVLLRGAGGETYELIWTGYDASTNTATYTPADRLPTGNYTLEFDSDRLRDVAGHELAGLQPVEINIESQGLGAGEGAEDAALPMDVGYLYPNEVSAGIQLTGFAHSSGDSDTFVLTLPGRSRYELRVTGDVAVTVTVRDSDGNVLVTLDGTVRNTVAADGQTIWIEVVSQGVGQYAISIAANRMPEVPISLNLPLPDLKVSMVAPGTALPAVAAASADPAVRFADDPTVSRVLETMQRSAERTAELTQLACQELPRQQSTSQHFGPLTPPLANNALFPARMDGEAMDNLLSKDALRLEQHANRSLRTPVDLSSAEAIAYAIRALWTPSPVEDQTDAEIDWAEIVRGLQQVDSREERLAQLGTPADRGTGQQVFNTPDLPGQTAPSRVEQPDIGDQANLVAAAALGTGVATTPPVRRSLAALLYRLANWLAS